MQTALVTSLHVRYRIFKQQINTARCLINKPRTGINPVEPVTTTNQPASVSHAYACISRQYSGTCVVGMVYILEFVNCEYFLDQTFSHFPALHPALLMHASALR